MLALALARRRHETEEAETTIRDENGGAGGSFQGDAPTLTIIPSPSSSSSSSSNSSTEHKVNIDTGHLVLYIIAGFIVGVFVPVLLIVFCTETKDMCRRRRRQFGVGLLPGRRGRTREREREEVTRRRKKHNRQQQIIALHPLNTPFEQAVVPVPRDWVVDGNPAVSEGGAAQGIRNNRPHSI
ncbi:lactobacillus shifted protein [Apiospora arundinis]